MRQYVVPVKCRCESNSGIEIYCLCYTVSVIVILVPLPLILKLYNEKVINALCCVLFMNLHPFVGLKKDQ